MAGPLAVGQQVLYERTVARAGPVVRVEHPNGTGAACAVGHAGAIGIAGLLAGNILIIILRPAAAVIAPAGFSEVNYTLSWDSSWMWRPSTRMAPSCFSSFRQRSSEYF